MNPLAAWKRPVAMIEQAAGLAALGWLWYWWLGLAESTTPRVLLSLLLLCTILGGLWLLIRRGRARLAEAAAGPGFVALLLFVMSLAAAYYLIWWVPGFTGLRAQMASVGIRFATAFLLVITFWGHLLASLGHLDEGGDSEPRNQAA